MMKTRRSRAGVLAVVLGAAVLTGPPASTEASSARQGDSVPRSTAMLLLQQRDESRVVVVDDVARRVTVVHAQALREAELREQEHRRQREAEALRCVGPAAGVLSSGFGFRWGAAHQGVDIANEMGTPVRSVRSGVVVEAGPASGFGLWIRVQHADGTITVYGHVDRILAFQGRTVEIGQQIATMGNRGQSTGPHLHFEVWAGGTSEVDPLSWLNACGAAVGR